MIFQYQNPNSPDSLKSLNMLCVRLVFCFYADKASIFRHNQFRNYLQDIPVSKWNRELKDLFRIFDTEEKYRDRYEDDLNAFPYVNECSYGMDSHSLRKTEKRLPLFQRHRLQQFPVVQPYTRTES